MNPIAEERRAETRRIVDDLESADQRCDATYQLESPEELLELAHYYNWDDGMAVPHAIIDHPACDLGLALHMFELAEGTVWITSDNDWKYQEEWAEFCKVLATRIQAGKYSSVKIPFESQLMKVQQYKAKKNGVADIFLNSVIPESTKS